MVELVYDEQPKQLFKFCNICRLMDVRFTGRGDEEFGDADVNDLLA